MANRKISEFPAIDGVDIDEQDLLTLVHVFEVNPTLRNKQITFAEFRSYLDQYYANITGDTISGNVTINGSFSVTGSSTFNTLTASGSSTFSGIVVQNNATVSGTLESAAGVFTNISGTTYTGTTVNASTGVFQTLTAANLTYTGTVISGDFGVLGTSTFSGVVSGSTSGLVVKGSLIIL